MNFLQDYLSFNECNEAHTNYHLASAFVTLAATIGRRVWYDYGHRTIYTHLYVVLVGPAGNRKSTAMLLTKRMMRETGGIPFAAQLESREGLIKQMAANEVAFLYDGTPTSFSPMTICVGELKDFLGVSMVNMINFTTAVWDQDYYDYKLRNKEDLTIVNPFLCVLACDTPEWITQRLRDDVLSGGFSRRTLFVYERDKARLIARPKVTVAQRQAWDRCVRHLKWLQENVIGPFKETEEASRFFDHWYEHRTQSDNPALHGYYDSKHELVFKFSMLLVLSELSDPKQLVIEKRHFQAALEILGMFEEKLPLVFQGIGRNELAQVTSKITDLLEIYKAPMPLKQLRATMWNFANGREMDDALTHLQNSSVLAVYKTGVKDMVVLRTYAPKAVLQALERANVLTLDSSSKAGQPSSPQTTQSRLVSPPQETQPAALTPSAEGIGLPPKVDSHTAETSFSTPLGQPVTPENPFQSRP